ncbi:MAG: hypothetical protein AB1898_24800 [Acidobacteriota bacterium]
MKKIAPVHHLSTLKPRQTKTAITTVNEVPSPDVQDRLRLGGFVFLLFQLLLLDFVVRQFQIESSAFLRVMLLGTAGFSIHAFLPMQYRLPFFVILSFSGILLVFGAASSIWLTGIGLLLIGLCHLPIRFHHRVAVLVLAGCVLVTLRTNWVAVPWSPAVWPILGSMFMFRLIVYVYDLRHEQAPTSPWRTLAYFFMLPNVCFPLFPVVDYRTFRRTYYSEAAYQTYQLGIDWMARGITHLIAYRYVYQHLTLSPAEIIGGHDLLQFLLANFLLYLRVSGQFHLIVGMLHLFGFRLPETHHLYYFASSFTDFWRRINIYWKDFMLKIFYYPIYFRIKKWGEYKALIFSTAAVFLLTWFLHAYQWFWLRGTFLLSWQDGGFWAILGGLVIINALYESKYGRKRTLKKPSWSVRRFSVLSLKTVGTFSVICVLWSLWTSDSISAWVSIWSTLQFQPSLEAIGWPLLLLPMVIFAGRIRKIDRFKYGTLVPAWGHFLTRSTASTLALLIFLALIGVQEIYTQLGPSAATVINSLRSGQLSRLDNAKLERGYYEQLLQVDRFNSQLWEVYKNKPLNWLDVQGAGLERFTGDFNQKELIPAFTATTSYGTVRTNRWGMRDKDYQKSLPPNTFRVALLGASSVMGWGVQDHETFEWLLEEHLNDNDFSGEQLHYEILNFAVPGYQPLQQLLTLDRAITFQPNAVFYVATGREADRSIEYIAEVTRKKISIPYDYLNNIVRQAGITEKSSETDALKRLAPFRNDLLSWLYRHIVSTCLEQRVVPVWIFLPMTLENPWQDDTPALFHAAEEAGFVTINLIDVFKHQDVKALRIAEWDTHPNARAHQLIATALYEAIKLQRSAIFDSQLSINDQDIDKESGPPKR